MQSAPGHLQSGHGRREGQELPLLEHMTVPGSGPVARIEEGRPRPQLVGAWTGDAMVMVMMH